jgi:hypothetical protein
MAAFVSSSSEGVRTCAWDISDRRGKTGRTQNPKIWGFGRLLIWEPAPLSACSPSNPFLRTMKNIQSVLALSAASLLLATTGLAQNIGPAKTDGTPVPPATKPAAVLTEADRAWLDLKAAAFAPTSAPTSKDPQARQAYQAEQARMFLRTAERARKFHQENAGHAKSPEAKLIEVRALVGASQAGDAAIDGRLTEAVETFRRDPAIPASLRVQIVAAYAFPKAMRTAQSREGRLAEAVLVARSLAVEFPDQPQGADSLVNLAAVFPSAEARQLINEVLAMPAPAASKEGARALMGRLELVGKPVAAEFDGADLSATKAALTAGRPTLIYTWASWSPGSFALAADLRKLNPTANIVGLNLDEDTATAEAMATKENLVGKQIYDKRGRQGSLAQRLKVRGAAQVILTDAAGVILDVRGETDLKQKLQSAGL